MPYTPVSGAPAAPTQSSYRPVGGTGPAPASGGYKPVSGVPGQQEDEGGFGVFDFLGNVAEEAGAMVQGVGTLIGAGVHDLSSAVKEGVTLGQAETDFVLDDIVKAMPGAIAQDYNSRYGISKFAQGDI